MQRTDLKPCVLYLTADFFYSPLQLLSDCYMCLSLCTEDELSSIAWVLVLISPSTSQICLVGQDVLIFC